MTPAAMPFSHLPAAQARVLLVDPPWTFRLYSSKGQKKSPQAHYRCMTLEDIKALPVKSLADPNGCSLVMWATAPMLPEAIATMAAWGFAYKSAGPWAKQSSTGGKWAFGPGYVFRSAAEFFLVGSIGKPIQKIRNQRNLIVAPVREHSRKPDEMRRMCERMWDGPYVELFARERATGWSSWGDQQEHFSTQPSVLDALPVGGSHERADPLLL